jgi:carbon monoxide dehydrogenase subunit G
MIAGVGQRIMGGFAKKQIENFFSTFEKELKTTRGD